MSDEDGHHASGGRQATQASGNDGHDIFFAAVQMSRMPMCLSDPNQPDIPVVFCNRAFETLTGYTRDEIVGRNCRFLQGDGTDRIVVAAIARAVAEREDTHQELLNYRKDGTPFWNALFISPVVDPSGRLLYFFGSQVDVTRRREAEAVVRQSQRMETLGSIASNMAHEFNNLMTIVLASLDRLDGEADPSRRDRYVGRAVWGARRASRLTDQMLSFGRRQFHDNQTVDLNQAIGKFDGILGQMAGSGVSVALRLANEPLVARVDPGQLELALLNLVRNAADSMGGGGEVVIGTRARPVEAAGDRAAVEIFITDRGTGMPPDVARRATEPFFTTKPRGKGTGLGLSMANGFAEQSNGKIEIESRSGTGTTVRLVFPNAATPR